MKFKKKPSNKNEIKIKTRKELRKEKRQEKKQKKNEYFANRKLNKSQGKVFQKNKKEEKENIESIVDRKKNVKEPVETTQSMLEKQRNEEKSVQKRIQMGSKTVRNKQLISANQDEEKEIKRLEKLLNMNKRKSKKIPSSFVSDGLDYLLELCDSEKRKEISEYESQARLSEAESDFDQDLAEVTGRKNKKTTSLKKKPKKDAEDSDNDSDNSDIDFETEDFEEEEKKKEEEEDDDDFHDEPLKRKTKRNQAEKPFKNDEENSDSFENDSESEDFEEDEEELDKEFESNEEEFDENDNDVDGEDEFDNIDEESDDFDNDQNENNDFKGFDSDDSIHESDFDEDFGESEDDDEDSVSEQENTNSIKGNKILSKEERMKALIGFVNKESSGEKGKRKHEDTLKDSGKRVKFADEFGNDIKQGKEKKLSKEERMKALMGYVSKESKNENKGKDINKDKKLNKEKEKEKKLTKEERMKALMGFVNEESKPIKKEAKLSKEERMKKLLGFVNDEKDNSDDDEGEEEEEEDGKEKGDGTWEDIYGRMRDKDGNIVQSKSSTYIPPHLRTSSSSNNSESLLLLKRSLKGLLNRLTENNIKSISSGVETLYSQHSRHDTNQTLLSLLRDSLLGESLTGDKMIMEHALLVTVLHANVGTEIGATLLQSLVQEFHHLFQQSSAHQVVNKRLDNYLSLLIGLYQFKVVSHNLVYDLIQVLIDGFEEKTIELLLVVLKTIGLSLRKDNAVRFKSALLDIQSRATASASLADTPRTRFMLEILLAVKNNNVHKIPGYDVTMVTRMRGTLKFLIRPSCYVSELNISLQDLLRADEKGRWWIVGSAWTGKDQQDIG
ncbi:hypothetical protein WDU94_010696 [Cyamophila willieti]